MPDATPVVPDDVDADWTPEGYETGPDDPGPVPATHHDAMDEPASAARSLRRETAAKLGEVEG